ncbi:2-hydroxy-6-oxo-6-phenylhexa-2,4-dienoate hydrolase, partial [Klebsiella pneumoniae]
MRQQRLAFGSQPQTEAATSRFLNVDEGGRTLRIHINDCGDGK